MILVMIAIGVGFIILERIIPDQKLPHVKGWWSRVILINLLQLGVLFLGRATWDRWLQGASLFDLSGLPAWLGGLVGYLVITFVFYWWHRWRHEVDLLWNVFLQVHHSPQRIETITSFFKHPLEIVANSIIIGSINFLVLGLSLEAAGWSLLYSSVGEYIYHMNVRTPHAMGYFFQRPEMHRIHHERGRHFNNFSDLPVWDMLFGTYANPKEHYKACGFKPEREARLMDMLLFRNVNDKRDA